MMKLVTTYLVALILLGAAGIAKADDEPFVKIIPVANRLEFERAKFPKGSIMSGKALLPSILYSASASLTLKVDSNCLHGPIVASMSELKHTRSNKTIPLERISIKAPTTQGFVPMTKPVIISNPENGSHDINLDFRVERFLRDPAGKFSGTITFTIIPSSF